MRERSSFIARARFLCWLRSSWQATTVPVGTWVMRTADSVLLTCWQAALLVGRRHALHAMAAGLELQEVEHAGAAHREDPFLEAALLGRRAVHDLDRPAHARSVALVQAGEVAGEQRRLLAAGTGADLDDAIAAVGDPG